jgi:hypothetical protein
VNLIMTREEPDRNINLADKEQARLDWLRKYTDSICAILRLAPISEEEAHEILVTVRQIILAEFPGMEAQYDVIYERRFRRILIRRGMAIPLFQK